MQTPNNSYLSSSSGSLVVLHSNSSITTGTISPPGYTVHEKSICNHCFSIHKQLSDACIFVPSVRVARVTAGHTSCITSVKTSPSGNSSLTCKNIYWCYTLVYIEGTINLLMVTKDIIISVVRVLTTAATTVILVSILIVAVIAGWIYCKDYIS